MGAAAANEATARVAIDLNCIVEEKRKVLMENKFEETGVVFILGLW